MKLRCIVAVYVRTYVQWKMCSEFVGGEGSYADSKFMENVQDRLIIILVFLGETEAS